MSELSAEFKVQLINQKAASSFFDSLNSFIEKINSGNDIQELDSDIFDIKNLSFTEVPNTDLKLDKSTIHAQINGGTHDAYRYIEELYSYFIKNKAKKIIGWQLDDRTDHTEYFLYHKNELLSYQTGTKQHIDKKLKKAEKSGDLLNTLESLLRRGIFGKTKADLDKAIRDYVRDPSFKECYVYYDELRTEKGSDGETLLTAMIKAGHDEGALHLLEPPNELDPCICNAKGELPILLAQKNKLEKLLHKLDYYNHKPINLSETNPEDLVRMDWIENPEDYRAKGEALHLDLLRYILELAANNNISVAADKKYPNNIYLSSKDRIIPGEDLFWINPYYPFDEEESPSYSINYYSVDYPNEFYNKYKVAHAELLTRLNNFINR